VLLSDFPPPFVRFSSSTKLEEALMLKKKFKELTEKEILALAIEGAEKAGSKRLKVKIGDARLFDDVISALGLREYWRRRVRRGTRGRR